MKNIFILVVTLGLALAAPTELEEFVASNREFTGSVYSEVIVDNKDNILVSPFSLETVLALTQSGAKDETAAEIRSTLRLPQTEEETESVMKAVLPSIQGDHFTLKTANKIYVEENYAIKETFTKVAKDVYQAEIQNIEFSQNVEAAATINKWVEDQTANKIRDFINADDLSGDMKVVLINALYFQGNWSVPFVPQSTKKEKFFISNEDTVDADTMYVESNRVNYFESAELDAQIIELPFMGEGASMTFVLPMKKEGIAILEKQSAAVLATPKYTKEFVEIALPKFRVESTIDFNEILPGMGMHKAFDPVEADFSGIAGEKGELFIGKVLQKTFIDVNEIGVEAAAVTDVGMPDSAVPPSDYSFIADHPFAFYIKVNDIVLFEGRVLVPEYKN